MPVKKIGKYVKPNDVKPYEGIGLASETELAFDNLYAIIIRANDRMILSEVSKTYKDSGSGIAIIVGDDVLLFFTVENGKSEFFWTRQGKGFGLVNVEPGQYWTFSNGGALWVRLDDKLVRRNHLWQSFSSRYPEDDSRLTPKKPQKADGDGSEGKAASSMKPAPAQELTPDLLKALGF